MEGQIAREKERDRERERERERERKRERVSLSWGRFSEVMSWRKDRKAR